TEGNVMEMVHWAMDVQGKDTRRAEMFYEQKVQLAEAMLQVQHSNSALENLNKRLEVAQQKAEQASQTKSVFLSNMSHELRTPLNIVIGYSSSMLNMPQMFEGVELPEIYRPYLKLIEDNGHYLLGLINDILDLSKIEAGKLELHPIPVDLPELLRGTVSTAIGLLKDKPLQLRPDFPDQLPAVWADPLRVRQIILNLMSNAIKFTHTGNVTLSAQVEEDRIRISISDTGIGIPEKALKTIFDRFQQAEHDTDKHYGGTGLGLDISKQLSQMHGDDLTVTSVVNQGSTFSFTLPIMMRDQLSIPQQPADETHDGMKIFDSTEINTFEKQAILLVEDEVNTREMLHIALESAGYLVIDANEGQQGMELASGLLPDLILLDAMLPGMDGWDMLGLLKADRETESIPVIMFTAAPDPQRAYDMGVVQVLTKPVTPAQILSSIQGVLKPIIE
ncbi:MAG: ATP-binding protein, partial [Chloroflexota bacterium]